ncbi:hypothetical protein Spea_2918 [Shewanella pealeana ATCC 700345]|uniref:Uncharacterized protein n=1 Tax=Shewanella pealeana (strain ATCC 700345 / ANG-SQ1) TaxID=398579 RepID=A8H6P8_SHEPA|nr:hypothetical protein Spea_2918 [Shewanella pealeana ATCC 700345]
MKNVVNDDKIGDFRDLVNSNSSFVYHTYKDKNGKNLFHLVCSCMDCGVFQGSWHSLLKF